MIISKIKNYLLLALLLALPWQTRLIYKSVYVQDKFWEYGSLFLYGSEILTAILILIWIIDRLRDKNFRARLEMANIKRVMVILGVYAILAFYFFISANHDLAWQYLNWMIYAACVFIIVLESEFSFYKISLFVWSGAILPSILGIYQFFSQSVLANKWLGLAAQNPFTVGVSVVEYLDERWLRAYGSFGSPNALGIYLSVIFLLGVILILKTKHQKTRILLLIGQLIIVVALFFSFSRGAYLGAFFGLIILVWQNRKNILFFQQFGLYVLLGAILLFAFFQPLFVRVNLSNRLEAKSIFERMTQWQDFKIIFTDHPLFGVGPGNYPVALQSLHPQFSANYFSPIHNIYLFFLGQFGLVGLLFVICGVYYLYKNIKKRIKIFAPFLPLLISGLFDHWSLSMFTGWIFFALILALAAKISYIDTNSAKE
ncbi:MAG: O-antigen ligase family protein [Candidatus Magasanikbacteria bacterium]|nr:O-antigen ligase family protein [Candidatus Magasanikbacteria bacterium]